MKTMSEPVPSSSQTVGPYFSIGLEYLIDRAPNPKMGNASVVEIRGRVLDRDCVPVPDAMLEFWSAALNPAGNDMDAGGYPSGFMRVATDKDGNFTAVVLKPKPASSDGGITQAPHLLVLVFARGLLRNLVTCVYFEDEPANSEDPILLEIPIERRGTLVAQLEAAHARQYNWDVILQGQNETVFFDW